MPIPAVNELPAGWVTASDLPLIVGSRDDQVRTTWGATMKSTMGSRLATDEEVKRWQTDGWVFLEGLISTDEIDAAATDLEKTFPSNDDYQADPEGVTEKWKGRPALAEEEFVWPEEGPGFRPEQHVWSQAFPFPGEGKPTGCAYTLRLWTSPNAPSVIRRFVSTRFTRPRSIPG